MTSKQYKIVKLFAAFFLAVVFSQAIVFKNYLIPIIFLTVIYLILLIVRRKVKDVIADDGDYMLGGKSAFLTIQIYSWVAVIIMIVLYSLRDLNPFYESVALTLAYSTCLLMLLYAFIFRFYNKINFSEKKFAYIIFVIILAVFACVITLRLFSGEDNWICQNGEWIKHGNPSFPTPLVECK
jgi:uncharacterized membrane protein